MLYLSPLLTYIALSGILFMMATLALTLSEYQKQAIKSRAHAAKKRPRDLIIETLGIKEPELNWPDDYVPEEDDVVTYASFEEWQKASQKRWEEAQNEH